MQFDFDHHIMIIKLGTKFFIRDHLMLQID